VADGRHAWWLKFSRSDRQEGVILGVTAENSQISHALWVEQIREFTFLFFWIHGNGVLMFPIRRKRLPHVYYETAAANGLAG